jgi:hypothetical protein
LEMYWSICEYICGEGLCKYKLNPVAAGGKQRMRDSFKIFQAIFTG